MTEKKNPDAAVDDTPVNADELVGDEVEADYDTEEDTDE